MNAMSANNQPSDPQPQQSPPGKGIGQGMLIVSFVIMLIGLTVVFNGVLQRQLNPNSSPESAMTATGVLEVFLERNRQGHYVSNGSINGLDVVFMLDTGATNVAIPAGVAAAAGLPRGQSFLARTANGSTTGYATEIQRLQLGDIVLHDLSASIIPNMEGNVILLGMSALGRLDFSQQGSTLTLRQLP